MLSEWQAAKDEKLHLIILSPEFAERLDLKEHARELMAQIEEDLGRKLQWTAIIHKNSDNPHVHIDFRGVDAAAGPERDSKTPRSVGAAHQRPGNRLGVYAHVGAQRKTLTPGESITGRVVGTDIRDLVRDRQLMLLEGSEGRIQEESLSSKEKKFVLARTNTWVRWGCWKKQKQEATDSFPTLSLLSGRLSPVIRRKLYWDRANVVRAVNSSMVNAYWLIGRKIVLELQGGEERAGYGKQVIEDLSERLINKYGKGFFTTILWNFRMFYQIYSFREPTIRSPAGRESDKFSDNWELRIDAKLSPTGRELVAQDKSPRHND